MARFCSYCGKPIIEGGSCNCEESKNANSNQQKKFTVNDAVQKLKGFMESMKNRMGLGDPERNSGDAYERDRKNIVPDCVKPNEGEVPVKQYNIATLRNRILGIPYIKAKGRLQVTNKRVIFRAPGRCLSGRTTLQQEFAIDEVAGIEARREYTFYLWDMFIAIWFVMIGSIIPGLLISLFMRSRIAIAVTVGVLFGIAGCVPFFIISKKWVSKLLCLGGSLISFGLPGFEGGYRFLAFLATVASLLAWFTIFVYSIRPNLVLIVKTKGATPALDIKRRRVGFFLKLLGVRSSEAEDHTGFKEIVPAEDAEICIREANAIINDIQKLGDFGIDKWKNS